MIKSSNTTFAFEIIHRSRISKARVGRIHTSHGVIDTPGFVPVGTNAVIKAIDSTMIEKIGVQLVFCNTYHLLLQPGSEAIRLAGGLHSFMNYKGALITDSGGFQVFSLAYGTVHDELKSRGAKKEGGTLLKVTEEGVLFRSYRDGSLMLLTPETSIQAQKDLGADIIIPLDELPAYHVDASYLEQSLERTHRWEIRSLEEHLKMPAGQAMYAVIHGGIDPTLRERSCQFLSRYPFDGFAIGGSLGKDRYEMRDMLIRLMHHLPENKPNHLLGIGDTASLELSIPLGIDTFDSSHPTRCARHGLLFTSEGPVKILQTRHQRSFMPIDTLCTCYTCTHYTRAYVHHLFKAREVTALTLATIHNLSFMVRLMISYRTKILHDEL